MYVCVCACGNIYGLSHLKIRSKSVCKRVCMCSHVHVPLGGEEGEGVTHSYVCSY